MKIYWLLEHGDTIRQGDEIWNYIKSTNPETSLMIDTTQTKESQLAQGYFQRGTGHENILILGSCRTMAFLNYLVRWNDTIGKNRFTIRRIDPVDWLERGIQETIALMETNDAMRGIIEDTDIFIHEHLANYGMFNTDKNAEKNIYQFGLNLGFATFRDISIPNFNDHLILENDWRDYGAVTPDNYQELGLAEIEKFCRLCELTSFPIFGRIFKTTWKGTRYFWRPNHTSAEFTILLFAFMCEMLGLETDGGFWDAARQEDLFKEPRTTVTDRDRQGYGITW